ncbi:hypothetical protein NLG97_g4080 [Lecanicillium saksenae]|uniref:Uncharacterized protein n=1 Tax=Lecanicillium saksenae TaxID=468837 RepID=A0ACC1QY65_9HYPO|nr:hypothetical protein NLG97_g4080 [Lecanicillium saksenae]
MLRDIMTESVTLALSLCIVIAAWVMAKRKDAMTKQIPIMDASGNKMKELVGDTRIRRFSHGLSATYQKNQEHWKAPDGNMGYFFHRLLGECVGAQSGREWRNIRSLFDPIFTVPAVAQYIGPLREEIRTWLDTLPRHASATGADPSSFAAEMPDRCASLPLKLVAMVLYGDALSDELFVHLLELSRLREEVGSNAFMTARMISRLYAYLPTKANNQLNKYIVGFRNFNVQITMTAQQQTLECPLSSIMRHVTSGNTISMQQLLHTVDEILFENLDVASSALSYLLMNMACDVAIQQEVRLEAEQLNDVVDADSYLRRSDTFLELCCAESRRLCPSVWFTFCERSPHPKTIGGFLIPPNTDVTVDWRRISLESPIWSRTLGREERIITGYDFFPRRYEHTSKTERRYSQVGYGPGVRKCLGQHFANLLMRLVLFEVVSRYRISTTVRPWELGFRRDKFVLTPMTHEIHFDRL